MTTALIALKHDPRMSQLQQHFAKFRSNRFTPMLEWLPDNSKLLFQIIFKIGRSL